MAGRWVQLLVATFEEQGGVRAGLVLRSPDGRTVRVWSGPAGELEDRPAAAMRAVLRGMWAAREVGRALQVCVDPPEVAAWLDRRAPVPDRYVPWFVQIRALSHSYRRVEFRPASPAEADVVRRAVQGGPCDAPAAPQEGELVARCV